MREYIIRDWKALGGEEPEPEPQPEPELAPEAGPDDDTDEVEVPPSVADATPSRAAPAPPRAQPVGSPAAAPSPAAPASAPAAPRVQRFQTTLQSPRAAHRRETASGAAPGAPPKKRGERSFIIRYNGVFVGFFEAKEDVTPREAYIRVAQELAEDDAFDPERLELWKPVLLKSARPAKLSVVRGKLARFSWQSKKPVVVQESEEPPAAET